MTDFGLLVPHFGQDADQDRLIMGSRRAEELGFHSLWVRDHLVFHPHGMEGTDRTFIEPFVALSLIAGATERIGLGAATVIPFRHPIHLASAVASLSWLSRRNFDLGVGAGNMQHEFDAINMGSVKRPQLMREQVMIAQRLWAGDTVSWKSELYDFQEVDLRPLPLRSVPVWWGGATPAATRLAVDFCDGWLPGRIPFDTYEVRVRSIREMCAEHEKPVLKLGAIPVTSVGTDRADALKPLNVEGLLRNANNQRFWIKPSSGGFNSVDELDGSILAGNPEEVARGIAQYQEIGCDLLIFDFRLRFGDWLEQIELLARDVLPAVSGSRAASARPSPTISE